MTPTAFETTLSVKDNPLYWISCKDGTVRERNWRTGAVAEYRESERGENARPRCMDGIDIAELCGTGRWRWTLLADTPHLADDIVEPISRGEYLGADEHERDVVVVKYSGQLTVWYVRDGIVDSTAIIYDDGAEIVESFEYSRFERPPAPASAIAAGLLTNY